MAITLLLYIHRLRPFFLLYVGLLVVVGCHCRGLLLGCFTEGHGSGVQGVRRLLDGLLLKQAWTTEVDTVVVVEVLVVLSLFKLAMVVFIYENVGLVSQLRFLLKVRILVRKVVFAVANAYVFFGANVYWGLGRERVAVGVFFVVVVVYRGNFAGIGETNAIIVVCGMVARESFVRLEMILVRGEEIV